MRQLEQRLAQRLLKQPVSGIATLVAHHKVLCPGRFPRLDEGLEEFQRGVTVGTCIECARSEEVLPNN